MAEQNEKEKIVGGFKVLQEIQVGAGSQGTVYKAECVEDKHGLVPVGTVVALKVMAVQDEGGVQWRKLQKRTAELSRLDHPNVVKYHGCFAEQGLFNDVHVVVQEFLQGETLKERLAKQKTGLDVDQGLKIVDAALAGLEYTAGCGLVHRDVKPGNIFLCDDGGVKLIDFEIARKEGGTATASVGNIRGSFDYMSPDFTNPEFHGDVQSDVFSMGVVLHEVLCGSTPYERLDGDDKQANFAFLSRWSQTLSEGHSPIHVSSRVKRLLSHADDVIMHALAPKREERYRDFAEFRKALKGIRFRSLKNGGTSYQLLQFIGKGGFGEVFKARNRATGQLVAVKHLMKAAYAERFHREAKIMRKLKSPCFVQFVDFFVMEAGGGQEAFLVMAFLDGMPGSSLRDAIKRRAEAPMGWRDVFVAFARYADGLFAIHQQGIYHRDIKPSNLYYPPGHPGASAIMDLGIARDINGTATTGQVPGTLDYMPPEVVISGNRGDGGMDIYALGLCLYEALTGKMAFPRLPTGATAYATFFDRAKEHRTPTFDAPEVAGDPEILSLLKEMTNPDASKRMRNAGVLLMRLKALIKARFGDEAADADYGPATIAPTMAMPGGDAGTVATAALQDFGAVALEGEKRRVAGGRPWRFKVLTLVGLLVVLAAATVYRFRGQIFGDAALKAPPASGVVATNGVLTPAEDPAAKARREKEEAEAKRIAAEAKQLEEKMRKFEEDQKKAEEKRKADEARLEAERKKLEEERKAEEEARKAREEEARKAREEAERKDRAVKAQIAADKSKTEAQKAAEVKRIEEERKRREAEQAKRDAEEKARRDKEEEKRIAAQKEQQRKFEEQQEALKKQQAEMERQRKAMEEQQAALKKQQEDLAREEAKRKEEEAKRKEEAVRIAAANAVADKNKVAAAKAAQEAAIAKAVEEAKKKAEEEAKKLLEAQKAELERQLREAQEKAAKEAAEREAAAKKLEEERQAAEEARKKAEADAAKEKAAREAEAKRLEEERQKVLAAQKKAEEEAARIAKEKEAAERAKREAEEAQKKADAAEKSRKVNADKVKELVSQQGGVEPEAAEGHIR